MKTNKLLPWLIVLALLAVALPAAVMSAPPTPEGMEGESISYSYVWFDPFATDSDDECYVPNADQTFCLTARSSTDDWEWVFYLWMRFPADWIVHDIYVHGTPSCQNGGTFGAFSWSTVGLNEVRIEHVRYHANPSDRCEAIYCFDVTSGSATPGQPCGSQPCALVSWYWTGDGSGDPPHYPCSSDGYTPPSQPACDEVVWPPLTIYGCPSIYLPRVVRGG